MILKHQCQKCKSVLDQDSIVLGKTREEELPDFKDINKFIVNHVWLCCKCDAEIEPKLKIRIDTHREEVPLFHPVSLRNLLETFSSVDINYRNVFQRDIRQLRKNKSIFWNLIFFF